MVECGKGDTGGRNGRPPSRQIIADDLEDCQLDQRPAGHSVRALDYRARALQKRLFGATQSDKRSA
jgi:hypothetical protein